MQPVSTPSTCAEGCSVPCTADDHHYEILPHTKLSPCPALNALAHQGYLPRDGQNIGWRQLIDVLCDMYGLTRTFSYILVTGVMLGIGKKSWSGWRLVLSMNLDDLLKPGVCHLAPLANNNPRPSGSERAVPVHKLVTELVETTDLKRGEVTLEDFARWRVHREGQLRKGMPSVSAHIARGELALMLQVFGDAHYSMGKDAVFQLLSDQRLPADFQKPKPGTIGVRSTVRVAIAEWRHMAKICSKPIVFSSQNLLIFALIALLAVGGVGVALSVTANHRRHY